MRRRRILWGAIVFSTVLYLVIAYFFASPPAATLEEAFGNPIVVGLYVAALGAFLAAFAVRAVLRTVPAQTRMVVALAIFESAAIFGLLAAFVQRDWRLYLGPWGIALVGFLAVWPSSEEAVTSGSPASSRR